jgi:AraC-like DNA-binding protein
MNEVINNTALTPKVDSAEARALLDTFELLHEITSIRVLDLAINLQYSERTLRRKSQQHFAITPSELLQKVRLNQATLLLNTGIKCSQVWHQVGFSSHSYFSDLFKAHYGVMPSEYG